MRIDVARERGGVVAVQELVQGQLGVLGVGHVAGRDGEAAAHALDQKVIPVRVRVGAGGGGQLEPAEDLQRDQHRQTLAVGRALPDPFAAVVDGQRLHPLAAVRGQVFHGQHAARLAHGGHHPLGDGSAVERLRAGGAPRCAARRPASGLRITSPAWGARPCMSSSPPWRAARSWPAAALPQACADGGPPGTRRRPARRPAPPPARAAGCRSGRAGRPRRRGRPARSRCGHGRRAGRSPAPRGAAAPGFSPRALRPEPLRACTVPLAAS